MKKLINFPVQIEQLESIIDAFAYFDNLSHPLF